MTIQSKIKGNSGFTLVDTMIIASVLIVLTMFFMQSLMQVDRGNQERLRLGSWLRLVSALYLFTDTRAACGASLSGVQYDPAKGADLTSNGIQFYIYNPSTHARIATGQYLLQSSQPFERLLYVQNVQLEPSTDPGNTDSPHHLTVYFTHLAVTVSKSQSLFGPAPVYKKVRIPIQVGVTSGGGIGDCFGIPAGHL